VIVMRTSIHVAAATALAGFILLLTALAISALPSDHLDSPYIDQLPQRDIGDLFVWNGDATGGPAFLINLNPLTPPSPDGMRGLEPGVVYEFKIDTTGDYVADLAYKIVVEGNVNGPAGTQTVSLYRATGAEADSHVVAGDRVAEGSSTAFDAETPQIIEGANGELLFVGPRQDPFFFNFKGVMSPVALDLQFALSADGLPTDGTAANTFGPTNITAIVLEVPDLQNRAFNAWATTSINGRQEDRCGKSSVTAIFLPNVPLGRNPARYPYGHLKQVYNTTRPADDVMNYAEAFEYRLHQVQVDSALVDSTLNFFLPDVLRFDPAKAQAYPNGRNLNEDAVLWTIRFLNPFLAETDSTLHLPETNPQPLTSSFPYAAPPLSTVGMVGVHTMSCAWWDVLCLFRRVFAG
jgi:hypothetical protein